MAKASYEVEIVVTNKRELEDLVRRMKSAGGWSTQLRWQTTALILLLLWEVLKAAITLGGYL